MDTHPHNSGGTSKNMKKHNIQHSQKYINLLHKNQTNLDLTSV